MPHTQTANRCGGCTPFSWLHASARFLLPPLRSGARRVAGTWPVTTLSLQDLVGSREEQHEKQGAGSSHVALDSISRIVSSQQREQLVPTSLLDGTWALEVSSTGDKCQAILLPSEPPGLTPDTGAQDTAAYRSKVEYSTVVFWTYRDRDAPQPLPTHHGSPGPHPEPAASPGAPSPAAEDRDSASPGEFPLLLTLVMEGGDVQPKGVPAVGSQGSLTP